jgi:hypothetical protein
LRRLEGLAPGVPILLQIFHPAAQFLDHDAEAGHLAA